MNNRGAQGKSDTELQSVVVAALAEVAPQLVDVHEGTLLIGEAAVIDSIGFVTLLVEVEQRLDGQLDLAASFLDHGTEEGEANPFRTVGTLAHHLQVLMRHKP